MFAQCHIHGKFDYGNDDEGNESDRSDNEDGTSKTASIIYNYNMPYTRMETLHQEKKALRNESSEIENNDQGQYYCSAACYLDPSNTDRGNEGFWTKEEDALIRVQVYFMQTRKTRRAPCLIATMLQKPCSQVQLHMKKIEKQSLANHNIVEGDYKQPKKVPLEKFKRHVNR